MGSESRIQVYRVPVPLCGTFYPSFGETILHMDDGNDMIRGIYIDRYPSNHEGICPQMIGQYTFLSDLVS